MKETFTELREVLQEKDIQTKWLSSRQWETMLQFTHGDEHADVQIWHTGKGMISKFNFLQGSRELFKEIVAVIKAAYQLD